MKKQTEVKSTTNKLLNTLFIQPKRKRYNVKNIINKINLVLLIAVISVSFGLGTNALVKTSAKTPVKIQKTVQSPLSQKVTAVKASETTVYDEVSSLAVVANPAKYLNKHIKIKAKFDKFSTLGLDYKPAFKSSEKYITFLIKRDDVPNHIIPLSEMKNFLARDIAEKYIELSSGDDIEYCGTVFSNALGDVWINVEKFTVLNQKPKEKK